MKEIFTIVLSLVSLLGAGQQVISVDSILIDTYKVTNSKEIIQTSGAKILISSGPKVINQLVKQFSDSTRTNVYSDCQNRFLRKGDIAVIIADHIEPMPYTRLTGIQNCLFKFCENNPNRIEYYLYAITENRFVDFQSAYLSWLNSNERKQLYTTKRKKGRK